MLVRGFADGNGTARARPRRLPRRQRSPRRSSGSQTSAEPWHEPRTSSSPDWLQGISLLPARAARGRTRSTTPSSPSSTFHPPPTSPAARHPHPQRHKAPIASRRADDAGPPERRRGLIKDLLVTAGAERAAARGQPRPLFYPARPPTRRRPGLRRSTAARRAAGRLDARHRRIRSSTATPSPARRRGHRPRRDLPRLEAIRSRARTVTRPWRARAPWPWPIAGRADRSARCSTSTSRASGCRAS